MKNTILLIVSITTIIILASCTSIVRRETPNGIPRIPLSSEIAPTVRSVTKIPPTSISVLNPTLTPLPTLLSGDAEQLVATLLESNGDCKLPCWWGFTPGQTSWETAYEFLSSFAAEIYIPPSSPDTNFFADVIFLVPKEVFPTYLTQKYEIKDGVITTIETIPGYRSSYNLPTFLRNYGIPGEVWVRTYNQAREGDLPFTTVLFYPEQGILARFDSQADEVGEQIRGCPQQKPALVFSLWSPERLLTFDEAILKTVEFRDDGWHYRPLQEATRMDTELFYQTFKETRNSTCLETTADLWPSP